jgi:hypothetical protein
MLWTLFITFFKIGAFTFGSGYAMIPIIEAEVVAALPEYVERVVAVHTVSDELWEQAKRLIREHRI